MHYYKLTVEDLIILVKTKSSLFYKNIDVKLLSNEYEGYTFLVRLSAKFYLAMHKDNEDPIRSKLPKNRTLQRFFPESNFVGDMLLIKVDEDGYLVKSDWDVYSLRKFVMLTYESYITGWSASFIKDYAVEYLASELGNQI